MTLYRAIKKHLHFREATSSQNKINSARNRKNTSGFRGVHFHKASGRWRATCQVNGAVNNLGYFLTAQSASEAYKSFAAKHHGEFVRGAK